MTMYTEGYFFSWTQCSLIKQNLVVVSDTVLAHVGGLIILEAVAQPTMNGTDPLETSYSTICVIVPNLVAIRQTFWA